MTDITEELASLGTTLAGTTSDDIVTADVNRGHAALHRRRLRIGGSMSVAVLVIAGTVGYFAASSGSPTPGRMAGRKTNHIQPESKGTKTTSKQKAKALKKITLVDYVGQNPQGFQIASVPQGFNLETQASTPSSFVLSPPDGDNDPSSFVNKLVVTAEAGSEYGDWQSFGTPDSVNGNTGRIKDDGTATQIWFDAGNGVVVDVQAWDNIGLTEQQVTDFAKGVTTTPALELSHG